MALSAAVLACVAAACGTSAHATAPQITMGQQLTGPTPTEVTHAPLVTSTGAHFTLASLHGKVVVLSDFMSLCQESCPLDTANVVAAARTVEQAGLGDDFAFVSLTIDPVRDTTARLAAYRRLYGSTPADWTVATGDPATIGRLWKTLGVDIERTPEDTPAATDWLTGAKLTYDLTHDDDVFFFDAKGHGRYLLVSIPRVAKGAPIPTIIRRFMNDEGAHNLSVPGAQAWTLPQELAVLGWLSGHHIVTPAADH